MTRNLDSVHLVAMLIACGLLGPEASLDANLVAGALSEVEPPLPGPLEAGWKGVRVCEKLHEDREQRILRCTFPPAVGQERHFHGRHFGYVVAGGRMRVTAADGVREVDLATDSHFSSGGVAWHEVLNVGESTAVFLIVEPKSPPASEERRTKR